MRRIVVCLALVGALLAIRPGEAQRIHSGSSGAASDSSSAPFASAGAGQARSPRSANYAIDARLDVQSRVLTGTETTTRQEKIPRPFQRAGTKGAYFLVGRWFPRVGVLDPDGTWNCHQFAQTEFFADFGVYDVPVRMPANWAVGATGHAVATQAHAAGTATHTFHAEDVHDFAWTTSPFFRVYKDRFQELGLPPVDLELQLLPDHASLVERYLSSAKATLHCYATCSCPYAWDRLTIVDPPFMSLTDSMEYPMFVTGGSRGLTTASNRYTEADTIHEVGHQSFPRILGHYVRDEHLLSLEKAVRKMTSRPALRVRLFYRGLLRPGMAADITVFDPVRIRDVSTYQDPTHYSVGVVYVLVNGREVVSGGRITDARPGRALKGPGYRRPVP